MYDDSENIRTITQSDATTTIATAAAQRWKIRHVLNSNAVLFCLLFMILLRTRCTFKIRWKCVIFPPIQNALRARNWMRHTVKTHIQPVECMKYFSFLALLSSFVYLFVLGIQATCVQRFCIVARLLISLVLFFSFHFSFLHSKMHLGVAPTVPMIMIMTLLNGFSCASYQTFFMLWKHIFKAHAAPSNIQHVICNIQCHHESI